MSKQTGFAQGESAGDVRRGPLIGAGESPREQGAAAWSPLVDWSDVFPGNRGVDRTGRYDLFDAPVGITLEVEVGSKTEPLLVADREWEGFGQICPLSFWEADGRFHMLYNAYDRRMKLDRAAIALGGVRTCTCYAISKDALNWEKPVLGEVEFHGSKRNNIIPMLIGGTPFIDPSAPADERFRTMGQEGASFDPETGEELTSEEAGRRLKAAEQEPNYDGPKIESRHWISGWTSPDGIHWKRVERHLADMPSDGGTAAQYDPETGDYFAYLRQGGMGRRAIGLSRTDTFWHWPEPELILAPDPQDDPEVSFYGASYFPYPGRRDLHGMFLPIYHQVNDHMDNQLAFSRDGRMWMRPERRAVIPAGSTGSGEEGILRVAQVGLEVLPDGSWAALYEGNSMLHNAGGFMTVPPGQIRWARWDPHRLCGIRAEKEGRFTIPTVRRTQDDLRLNYRCGFGGFIEVELITGIPSRVHPDAQPISCHTFGDCDRLFGDGLDEVVTWKGNSQIQSSNDQIAIRLRLFNAKVFAYRA